MQLDNTHVVHGMESDQQWMRLAIEQAECAWQTDEVPVGAVVVYQNEIIGTGYNRCIIDSDPTAHAEIMALRNAAAGLKNYRLPGAILYVTLEPCQMCAGAMVHARIDRLVYAASDPKTGAISSQLKALELDYLNHKIAVTSGVLENECSEMLSAFFKMKRQKKS